MTHQASTLPESIPTHYLESLLHSSIASLNSQIPNPRVSASMENYKFQDEETKRNVHGIMNQIRSKMPNQDTTTQKSRQQLENEALGIETRNVTQFPNSVHHQFLKEMTQKNLPFVIRRYKSVAWCERVRRTVMQGEQTRDEGSNADKDSHMVTVAVTPNGRADAIFEEDNSGDSMHLFLYPEERRLSIDELLEHLSVQSDYVKQHDAPSTQESSTLTHHKGTNTFTTPCNFYYVQTQNDNLRRDFPHLLEHVEEDLEIGEYCFEDVPEAMNVWMGTDGTVSSLHRDFYENLYIVAEGVKEFLLYPPFMQPYLYERSFATGEWKETDNKEWIIHKKEEQNVWCAVDPEQPRATVAQYPWFAKATPYRVEVGPGDLLYLPATWFHQVSQRTMTSDESSKLVIAVNYWYPMQFESQFHYNQLVEKIGELTVTGKLDPEEE